MGDIKVGDKVANIEGGFTTVTHVHPIKQKPLYRVTLKDGSSVEACADHLWEIERWKNTTKSERLASGKTCKRVSEVVSTIDIKNRIENNPKKLIDLPYCQPIEHTAKDLPLDPYLLGVLLGDGHMAQAVVSCPDAEVMQEVEARGYTVTKYKARVVAGKNGKSYDACATFRVAGIKPILAKLGIDKCLADSKFIPEEYFFGSVEQRIDLLRGLMDTDGYVLNKGRMCEMEYATASNQLAIDVQRLIRSLGGRVSINVKDKVMFTSPNQLTKKQGLPSYRVQNIRLPKINPFYVPRKAERWRDRFNNLGNSIVSVELIKDSETVRCITVADKRGLYVVDDYVPTHNTSNIVFLKSTDDSMLDTLQKMSGTTHKVFVNQKTITRDMERIYFKNEGKASYMMSAQEVPVIAYNDMAFIPERNSIIFRAGDSPIWNRNETILPMSWRLFSNTIIHPGHEYTLQTLPTLSSAKDFDVRKNQPDFQKMLDKRITQALAVEQAKTVFQGVYDYSDYEINQLDPDDYADEVFQIINTLIREEANVDDTAMYDEFYDDNDSMLNDAEANTEQAQATRDAQAKYVQYSKACYAGGLMSRDSFMSIGGIPNHQHDKELISAFNEVKGDMWQDTTYFLSKNNGNLYGTDGVPYIIKADMSADLQRINNAKDDAQLKVYADENIDQADISSYGTFSVTDDFLRFLVSMDKWSFANGKFDKEMKRLMSM